MDLFLLRRYHATGTTGEIYLESRPVCKTLEQPWRCNLDSSCIPEGSYPLRLRYFNRKQERKIEVCGVHNRRGIYFDIKSEFIYTQQGCIAPVSVHLGPGRGEFSQEALEGLESLIIPLLEQGEEVWLHIVDEDLW